MGMEERAVEISYELWKQMLTQGHTSGGYQCVHGLPQDARLIEVFWKENGPERLPSLCAAFLAEQWPSEATATIQSPRTAAEYGCFAPVLQETRCATCAAWSADRKWMHMGEYRAECAHGGCSKNTPASFGCVRYSERATDD